MIRTPANDQDPLGRTVQGTQRVQPEDAIRIPIQPGVEAAVIDAAAVDDVVLGDGDDATSRLDDLCVRLPDELVLVVESLEQLSEERPLRK